ncbi:MAG: hypothetical protein ACJ75H_23755 [Thermoanaerobaculia bacterium]
MRLSALDCLRRGWTNLSANWELVFMQWLQAFVVLSLMALGAFLFLLILGVNLVGGAGEAEEAMRRLANLPPALLLGLTAMLSLWLLSLFLHCYFQAGTYGVLTAAERQALPGPRRDRTFFRTFSLRDFLGWSGLYVWRFFGLLALFWAVAFGIALVALAWMAFTGVAGVRWGAPAAFGAGLGGALPMAFLVLVLALWVNLAQAGLAREGSGVRLASRQGLSVLGRRLGAIAGLFLLGLIVAVGVALAFVPLSLAADALLADVPRTRALVRFLLFLMQSLPNTLLAMVLAGALVALVRSETPGEGRRKPEVLTA